MIFFRNFVVIVILKIFTKLSEVVNRMEFYLWQCIKCNCFLDCLLQLRIFFDIFLLTYRLNFSQFFALLIDSLFVRFLQNWEVKWAIIMYADNWPIWVSHRNNGKVFAFIISINKLKFALFIFSHMENSQLALANRILRGQRLSDCANDINLVLWSFYDLWLSNQIWFFEMINKVIS